MPGIRTKIAPLIARDTPHPALAGDAARAARALKLPGAEQLAKGFENLSAAVQQLLNASRQNTPEITEFVVTDPIRGVIASLGEYEKNGIKTSGGYFSELYAGDPYGNSDPADAIFKVTPDGKVQVGENGWLDVLDPYAESAAWIGTQFDTLPVTGAMSSGGLVRLTVTAHTLATGDAVRVLDVGGVPNATGIFTVTSVNANTIDLQNSVFVGTYTAGGTVDRLLHITGAANNGSGEIRLTRAAHGYESGDKVNVQAVGGVPNATGRWIVDVASSSAFDLVGSTWGGAYTSGGTALRYFAGGLFQTIAIGPSFPNYKLRAFANGDLRIRDSQITLNGIGSTIDIDPAQGRIVVASTAPSQYRTTIADGTITLDVWDGDPVTGSGNVDEAQSVFLPGWAVWSKVNISTDATSPMLTLIGYATAAPYGPRVDFHHRRGSPLSATATQADDVIGGMVGWGFDGTGESAYVAGVSMLASENHTVPNHGTKIVFETTPNGSTVRVRAVTIDQNGQTVCDIGATPVNSQFLVKANALGAIALLCYGADNQHLLFDSEWSGSAMVARDTSAAQVAKLGDKLRIDRATGLTPGNTFGFTVTMVLDLATGAIGFGGNATPGYAVDATGDINASGIFRKGGTAGINLTAGFGMSLTVNNDPTALHGTPGAGQSQFSAVTGVTLNTTSRTFSGGILTA